jgi:hypothetical protein
MARDVRIELEYRRILPLEDAAGTRVDCLRGCLWITENGSTKDIVLEAGESYVLTRDGVALLQALRRTLVGICMPAMQPVGASEPFERFPSHAAAAAVAGSHFS